MGNFARGLTAQPLAPGTGGRVTFDETHLESMLFLAIESTQCQQDPQVPQDQGSAADTVFHCAAASACAAVPAVSRACDRLRKGWRLIGPTCQ